ncbi:hypothetical protein FEM03_18105 [Phragmitibacter flavus]|uniref:TPM domain-containing protein n=1 Tax=Phragmitibacter flavus TaxID=2576071 RepID=A0A5R8KAF6_9BACT|nr:hypothetical protein [Phragmitibacter flavus]TLD69286.1 hypothetical protein FEM03_18105 [Phragmitibacter flavus]
MNARALLFTLVAGLSLQGLAEAEVKAIPKEKEGRWGVYTFDEAKEEAVKKKKPLAILVIDYRTEEESVKEANSRAFWGMEKDATMVVVMSNLMTAAKGRMGETLYGILTGPDLGKAYPKLMVTSSDAGVVLGKMTAEQLIAADEKAVKAFGTEMEVANKNPAAAAAASGAMTAASTPGAVVIKTPVAAAWTNSGGQTIQAAVIAIAADKVVFQMPNGSKVDYPLANLDAASLKRVEELKAANAK